MCLHFCLVAEVLLEDGADPDQETSRGTPLAAAAAAVRRETHPCPCVQEGRPLSNGLGWFEQADAELVKLLVQRGANCKREPNSGASPIMMAVMKNSQAVLELLLAHGADPREEDSDGRYISSRPTRCSFFRFAHWLIRLYRAPLEVAEEKGYKDLVAVMMKQMVRSDAEETLKRSKERAEQHAKCVKFPLVLEIPLLTREFDSNQGDRRGVRHATSRG